jgi:hypothetical protein
MIIKEFFRKREDGVNLCRIYSDQGHYIKKLGTSEIYEEVIDVEDAPFKYMETFNRIKTVETTEDVQPEVAIENPDQEVTEEEIAKAFAEVF